MFDSGVEAEIMDWAAALVDTGQPADIHLGSSISLWVGAGMPNDVGVNQCVTACTMIAHSLSWLGRDAHIVPVTVQIHDRANILSAWGGRSEPQWTGTEWSGHCVLYLPDTRSLIDPTIGQFRPRGHQKPVLLANMDAAILTPGSGCVSPVEDGARISYTTLDSHWHPHADRHARTRHDHNRREMDLKFRDGFVASVHTYINSGPDGL